MLTLLWASALNAPRFAEPEFLTSHLLSRGWVGYGFL